MGVFSGKLCSVASSSAAFSSIFEGFFSAGSEGPASALAWLTSVSTSVGFVSASICIFEASAIFPEGIELEALPSPAHLAHWPSFFSWGSPQDLFVPSTLSLLPKGLKLLMFLSLRLLSPQYYQSSAQLM